jgi:hypothetical protein
MASPVGEMSVEPEAILKFQLDRKDFHIIVRLTAAQRSFRKMAPYFIAGFVFLGHAADGNYLKGLVWGVGVAALFLGLSRFLYFLHVYLGRNESFLVQQQLSLFPDELVVESESSREVFPKPLFKDVTEGKGYLILKRDDETSLIFIERSFEEPGGFQLLKNWLRAGN